MNRETLEELQRRADKAGGAESERDRNKIDYALRALNDPAAAGRLPLEENAAA